MSGRANTGASEHASALVIGENGLLILGESGAGKSSLALALIGAAQAQGMFARLVGDDRVRLEPHGGRLVARVHPVLAGQIEARGAGILGLDHLRSMVVDAVVTLEKAPERLPEPSQTRFERHGVSLPRLNLRADVDLSGKVQLVLQWLSPTGLTRP